MPIENYPVLGLFAGVGGLELGFKKAGFTIAIANEIDKFAAQTYSLNHAHPLVVGSVSELSSEEVLSASGVESIGVITGGFPCQPFSVAGFRKGFEDVRGNLFWEIHRLIRELKPAVVLLENVKNLQSHDEGRTYETIKTSLQGQISDPEGNFLDPGYFVDERVFNASDFGIPQNRERIFIVAFRDEKVANAFKWPLGRGANRSLRRLDEFIDFDGQKPSKYHYELNRIFPNLDSAMDNPNTVYQWRRHYVRENKSGVCPTLTANMGMGGHNVPLVRTRTGIRKLTPQECFALMGMPDLKLPENLVDSRLYKQAGNAVVVPVAQAIAEAIADALSAS